MNHDKKTVLVTGGAGFIGSHIVEELLEKNYHVVALDNFDDFLYASELKKENLKIFSDNSDFIFYETDVRDYDALKDIFEKHTPSYVIHLAAKADARKALEIPKEYVDVNITGTFNVLELSKDHSVENLVFISSSSVYGNQEEAPLKEGAKADKPLSQYGATKRAGEILAYGYHHNYGLNVTCLRYFTVYGPRMRPTLVHYKWVDAILHNKPIDFSGKGVRERDYTYVKDIVDGTIKAMEKPLGYEIINLGNSNPISLKELLAIVEKETGTEAEIIVRPSHPASVEKTFADITKAKELLGWVPKISIEEGIRNLVSWFRDERLR